jgi:protocatechuate 3,4-dioxygenase beta subunit
MDKPLKHWIIIILFGSFSACNGQDVKDSSKTNLATEEKDEIKQETWKTVIPPADESGDRLIVSGIVYSKDGNTANEGLNVHVYHTDMYGYYSKDGENESRHRLKGDMITNAEGKYQFRTIKPGAYPSGNIPAHIHFVISGDNIPEQQYELLFEGDPLISERTKKQANGQDAFFQIRPLMVEKDGTLQCNFNITLRDE